MANMVNGKAKRLGGFLRRWRSDRRGSYAVIFAIALVPILIAIGAAVDISKAYVVKQRLTRALDAAGLAVGGTTGMTTAQIQEMAQNFFNANYPASKIGVPGTLVVSASGNIVNLSVRAAMPTSVIGLVGIENLNINATSQITRMGKKLEVVLVLDTTGSMDANNKFSTMKTAAKDLITTVSAAAINPGDVKIAIVPFTTVVNVGSSYKNETWLKWTYAPTTAACTTKKNSTTCSTTASATAPKTGWSGCVIDRDQNYDISVSLPTTSNAATLFPADGDTFADSSPNIYSSSCATSTLMPLSTNWTALNNAITNLKSGGGTNTTIGLVWGWQMLTQGATLSTAAAVDTQKLDKVIVFLTDGDNTFNRQKIGSCNGSSSCTDADNRTAAVCSAIKNAGVLIYTIRVMDGNASLLRDCATNPSMYYSVTAASQLTSVFQSIAQALSNLRISQ